VSEIVLKMRTEVQEGKGDHGLVKSSHQALWLLALHLLLEWRRRHAGPRFCRHTRPQRRLQVRAGRWQPVDTRFPHVCLRLEQGADRHPKPFSTPLFPNGKPLMALKQSFYEEPSSL
jgi:hypothetical protein